MTKNRQKQKIAYAEGIADGCEIFMQVLAEHKKSTSGGDIVSEVLRQAHLLINTYISN